MRNLLFAVIALVFASFTASNKLNGNCIIKGAIGKTLTFTKAANPSAFKATKSRLRNKRPVSFYSLNDSRKRKSRNVTFLIF